MQEAFDPIFVKNQNLPGQIFSSALLTINILGVLFNFLILVSLLQKNETFSSGNRLVFSLITSNLISSTLILPFFVISSFKKAWMFGTVWCSVSAFLNQIVTLASFHTVALIAIDRYYAIVHPLKYTRVISKLKVTLMLIGAWIQALLLMLPPFIINYKSYFQESKSLHLCVVSWENNVWFSSTVFSLSFGIPLVILLGTYGYMYRVAQILIHRMDMLTPYVHLLPLTSPLGPVRKPSWLAITHSPLKGLAIISTIIGSFLVSAGPYYGLSIVRSSLSPVWVQQLSYCLLASGSVLYPLVYGMLNRSIRKSLWSWIFPFFKSGQLPYLGPNHYLITGRPSNCILSNQDSITVHTLTNNQPRCHL